MKILGHAALLMLLFCGSAGCALLQARTVPEGPPLAPPPPPPRVLAPVAGNEPVLTPRPAPPRVERADLPPPAVSSPPAEPPLTLQTTASAVETEQHVRALLANAARDLARIDYRALGENAKAQYDVAKRFSEQAQGALRDNNVVFAEQLADKAAVLAALLLKR